MKRSASVEERLVTGAWVLLIASWSALGLWVTFSYDGATAASTWTVRLILLAIGGTVTAGVVLLVQAAWRRAMRMPLKGGRATVWLARRRWWQLALPYWVVLGVPQIAGALGWWPPEHQALTVGTVAWPVLASVIGASFMGLTMHVVYRRQLLNREMLERR